MISVERMAALESHTVCNGMCVQENLHCITLLRFGGVLIVFCCFVCFNHSTPDIPEIQLLLPFFQPQPYVSTRTPPLVSFQ